MLIDECVFFCDDTIFVVYVDNGLFLVPSECKLTVMIKALKQLGLKIEDHGHPSTYIGINIKKHHDGTYEFSQLALTDSILNYVGLTCSNKVKPLLMSCSKCLHAYLCSKPFYEHKCYIWYTVGIP